MFTGPHQLPRIVHRWPAATALSVIMLLGAVRSPAEICTTQSRMAAPDKDAIIATVRQLAALVQANDEAGLRGRTLPEYAKDPAAMASLVGSTAPRLQGAQFNIDQVYLLDATNLKTLGDGTNQDAQFFCTLNQSIAETEFSIPSLPPGRYGFAIATTQGAKSPWEISFLLRQDAAPGTPHWSMAGFYPRGLTAAVHDGLWYWVQARELVAQKKLWSGYLYYQQAQALLQPAGFVNSSHLEKLRKEATASAPPALSDGIGPETPLVIKGADGMEYRFTALTTDDSLATDKVDVLAHLQADPPAEAPVAADNSKSAPKSAKAAAPPPTPRERNAGAMAALLAAYPELRSDFHGVWIFADTPGGSPFATEEPMANIH